MPARTPAARLLLALFLLALCALGVEAQRLYWEDPRVLVPDGARFPSAATGGGVIAVVWQELVQNEAGQREVWLTSAVSQDAAEFRTTRRFAGPFPSQEREAPVFALAVDKRGRILVAAVAAERKTTIFASQDKGVSYTALASVEASSTSLTPGLFITSRGELLLFVSQERDNSLSVYFSRSRDGNSWSELQALVPDDPALSHLLPQHAAFGGKDFVAYQTRRRGENQYQLELKISSDGGATWSPSRSLAFGETVQGQAEGALEFSNQRPFLAPLAGRLGLVWERQLRRGASRVYYRELDGEGNGIGQPEAVTDGTAAAFFPRLILYRERPYTFFFSSADKVFVADRGATSWSNRELSDLQGSSYFAYPVELADKLFVFWENRVGAASRLVLLQPDQLVDPPSLAAVNFEPRRPSRQDLVIVRWAAPRDPSGIAGYNFVWSRNPEEPVPAGRSTLLPGVVTASVRADQDGDWYFRLAAEDFAGNWSKPATIAFRRDTTPPGKPVLALPPVDAEGYLAANSFQLGWQPADPVDAAGYAYALEFLGLEQAPVGFVSPALPDTANTTATQASWANLDNGLYAFAVAALDPAGNRGEPVVALLRLNRYIPVTYIAFVDEQRDPLGTVDLTIGGRGFDLEGLVGEVLLDRDAAPPYDYRFPRSSGAFRVVSDRLIRGLTLAELEEGLYRVGVVHPVRGLAWSRSSIRIESPGTVKFGDFSFAYRRPWQNVRLIYRTIGTGTLLAWLGVLFLLILFLASARRLAALAQEGRLLERDVLAVLRGEVPLARKVAKMEELKRKGVGLRLKFTALIMILVLITVLMVATPLSVYMISAQRRTLAQGLVQRVDALLGSLTSSAAESLNLTPPNVLQLSTLRDQAKTLDEAQYLTLTGVGVNDPGGYDYVWVSSDAQIDRKLEGGTFTAQDYGRIRLRDGLAQELELAAQDLNQKARAQVSGLIQERSRLLAEAAELSAKRDPASQARAGQLDTEANALLVRINSELQNARGRARSFPTLDPQRLLPAYVFYMPVVYRRSTDEVYFRGAIRLGVSTERISAEVRSAQTRLIIQTGIIALIAAGLGLVGAIVMAAITVNPIKKLAAGVAIIRDTEDKEKLREHRIEVGTKDEIGTLATTVNQMTQALVKAAMASKDLTVGKEVQKMFLPLAKDEQGRKLTTAGEQDDLLEIFGYYEGAKGVSGDYFDYLKLADKYYALIKCDVAGKGVPAALIMVEVATIFSTYFRNWTPRSPGLQLSPLADLINDMVEERGFKGRFAALTLAILNAETGKVLLCNAGDTTQRVYRQAEGSVIEFKLPDAPAAGVFPTDLVDMKGGFQQVPQQLASGDTLFLYTDGIEEAKRHFRDAKFQVTTCAEPGLEAGQSHAGTHAQGTDNEEMGNERIREIISSVYNRRIYRLVKHHNPVAGEELEFDFSRCRGTVEEAVLAMVAVEKVFRVYSDPAAGPEDRVYVDKRINVFLQEHFKAYSSYFNHPVSFAEGDDLGYQEVYSHLKEDEQYDDLTILAVRKK